MASKNKIEINPQKYQQIRYEISRDILASTLSGGKVEATTELKQRESLVFNCVQLADMLMTELGYISQKEEDKTVHTISNILRSSNRKDRD